MVDFVRLGSALPAIRAEATLDPIESEFSVEAILADFPPSIPHTTILERLFRVFQRDHVSAGPGLAVQLRNDRKPAAMAAPVATSVRPLQVLLVEDNPGDVRLTREAILEARIGADVHVATTGEEAMAFLLRKDTHANAPRPELILLDLNLPGMDGREILVRIRANVGLKSIPTVILTTSNGWADAIYCAEVGAHDYLSKPVEPDAFERLVKSLPAPQRLN